MINGKWDSNVNKALQKRWLAAQKAEEKFYRAIPPIYASNWEREGKKIWEDHIKKLMGIDFEYFSNKTVLEVGCGCYGLIHWLDNSPKRKVGVDPLISSYTDLIAKTPSTAEQFSMPSEELPFGDATFDTVISINVLDHTLLPRKCIAEMYRVMSPNGELFLELNTFRLPRLFRENLQLIDHPHPWHFSASDVIMLLQQTGFKIAEQRIMKTRLQQINLHFPPDLHMVKMIGAYFMKMELFYCRVVKL
jgi:ubiquinone/menaquinone biosynthesis C-methylase UbiE